MNFIIGDVESGRTEPLAAQFPNDPLFVYFSLEHVSEMNPLNAIVSVPVTLKTVFLEFNIGLEQFASSHQILQGTSQESLLGFF